MTRPARALLWLYCVIIMGHHKLDYHDDGDGGGSYFCKRCGWSWVFE